MEFYPIFNRLDAIVELFQFPTGWNSTSRRKESSGGLIGFNSQRDGILLKAVTIRSASKASLNSQRDGILLYKRYRQGLNFEVSIPNGMEFYLAAAITAVNKEHCFNSQRDGIPHEAVEPVDTGVAFQFPTGWNSTIPGHKNRHR